MITSIELFQRAQRYLGIHEIPGQVHHPLIIWWLSLCADQPGIDQLADETPWCSAFLNGIAWQEQLPRSHSARARSWLDVGMSIDRDQVQCGDVVVLSRDAAGPQAGHTGLFAGWNEMRVRLLAGNQGNAVSIASFASDRIVGLRRITL